MTGGENACWFCSPSHVQMLCCLLLGTQFLRGWFTAEGKEKLFELPHVPMQGALSALPTMLFLSLSQSKDRVHSTLPWKNKNKTKKDLKNHKALEEAGKFPCLWMSKFLSQWNLLPAEIFFFFFFLGCIM